MQEPNNFISVTQDPYHSLFPTGKGSPLQTPPLAAKHFCFPDVKARDKGTQGLFKDFCRLDVSSFIKLL